MPWHILIVCVSASFLVPFMSSSITIALWSISDSFNIDIAVVNWVANAFLVALAASMLPVGRIADWIGRGRIFVYGLAIFSLSSFLSAITPSFPLLILFRVLQGISGACISATSIAILSTVFPPSIRGRVIGFNTASVYTGLTLGPILGGFLVDYLGWRSLFLFVSIISAIGFIFSRNILDIGRVAVPLPSLYRIGLLAFSIASIVYGASCIDEVYGFLLTLSGVIVLIILLYLESLVDIGIIGRKLLRNRFYMGASLANLLNYTATYALSILVSLYLQRIRGFTAREAGLILSSRPIVQALLSPIAGFIADKYRPSIIASIGLCVIAFGVYYLMPLAMSTMITKILYALFILGLGYALFSAPNTTSAMNASPKKLYGTAYAFLGSMRFLGQAISTSIAIAVTKNTPNMINAINTTIWIYLFIAVFAAISTTIIRCGR